MGMLRRAVLLVILGWASGLAAGNDSGIDPEAIIERVLAVEHQQREELRDVVLESEYVELEDEGDKGFREKVRFVKRVFIKYLPDTTLLHEDYLEYYKEGKRKTEEELREEAAKRIEKRRKRKGRDISMSLHTPFRPDHRDLYDIEYLGVADGKIDDYVCHHFRVRAREETDSLINGDYYFEAESFHLVHVDFSPAKLAKKAMFRLRELNMSVSYGPGPEGFWLPRRFDIEGKGKAVLFFGVSFVGTEYFRNPIVNTGLDDAIFEEGNNSE